MAQQATPQNNTTCQMLSLFPSSFVGGPVSPTALVGGVSASASIQVNFHRRRLIPRHKRAQGRAKMTGSSRPLSLFPPPPSYLLFFPPLLLSLWREMIGRIEGVHRCEEVFWFPRMRGERKSPPSFAAHDGFPVCLVPPSKRGGKGGEKGQQRIRGRRGSSVRLLVSRPFFSGRLFSSFFLPCRTTPNVGGNFFFDDGMIAVLKRRPARSSPSSFFPLTIIIIFLAFFCGD